MNTQVTLKAALFLTLLAMLTACGPANVDTSSDFASRTTSPSNSTSASITVLNCNMKSQSGLTAQLEVYRDPSSNQIRNDYMKLRFTQMPSSLTSGDYIQFYRWQADSTNNVYLDPTPVQARLETLDGRLLTNFANVLSWSTVSSISSAWGISDLNKLFQNIRLVIDIRDPQANFDVLKVAMYNSSNSNTVNMDMLMPTFAISPKDYATDNGLTRSTNLQALHPFASYMNQTFSITQLQTAAAGFCF